MNGIAEAFANPAPAIVLRQQPCRALALTPGPSPANRAGEGRSRARPGRHRTASAGGPLSRPLPQLRRRGDASGRLGALRMPVVEPQAVGHHPSPEVGGGVASRREERAKRLAGERAWGSRPMGPHPRPLSRKLRGRGEKSIPLRPDSERTELSVHTTPPPKLGEGSPAVARNERKAWRGRGPGDRTPSPSGAAVAGRRARELARAPRSTRCASGHFREECR